MDELIACQTVDDFLTLYRTWGYWRYSQVMATVPTDHQLWERNAFRAANHHFLQAG